MDKKYVPATETHFKYINVILADLSRKSRREQKNAYRFKRWILNLESNMRLNENIRPEDVKELYKHYQRIMYHVKKRDSPPTNRITFNTQRKDEVEY